MVKSRLRKSLDAAARFHLRVGQHGRATHRCEHTLPLFPLLLILDADGTLSRQAEYLLLERRAA